MHYRKLRGDALFDGFTLHTDKVLVLDETGTVHALVDAGEAPEAEIHHGILSPGFINCHCHLELSHMKGLLPEKTGLVDFVFSIVTQRHQGAEEIAAAIAAAEEEMIEGGIVAVGDICNNDSTLDQKKKGRLYYHNFIEASGWLPAASATRYERALGVAAAFQTPGAHVPSRTSLVPHAPYSVSKELWQLLRPHFSKQVVSIHNAETVHEDEFFRTGGGDFKRMYALMKIDNGHHQPTGTTSLQSYYHNLSNARHALLVHDTFTTGNDIDFLREAKGPQPFFCLCPNANLYIEDALPPVQMLHASGVPIVLGTDSLASNWSLSIASEMAVLQRSFPQLTLPTLLQWATSNGAKALDIDDRFGSFEKGKTPGVTLLQLEDGIIKGSARL